MRKSVACGPRRLPALASERNEPSLPGVAIDQLMGRWLPVFTLGTNNTCTHSELYHMPVITDRLSSVENAEGED